MCVNNLSSEEFKEINKIVSAEILNLISDIEIKLGRKLTKNEVAIIGESFVRACGVARNIFDKYIK